MIKNFKKIILILLLSKVNLQAKSEFYQKGIDLFNKNKFEEAKFKFEQDIVLNPKSELSYLYLSKIFNKQNKQNFGRTKFIDSDIT